MYDAIIVGARCAGATTALLLARKGYKVLLVDRAHFPSDTISTHVIWPPGVAFLARHGLLEAVRKSNCPPVPRITFDMGEFALTGTPPEMDGIDIEYCPRRTVLDKLLVDAVAAAGAEIREGWPVRELARDGARVTGVIGSGGSNERARIVIGADGRASNIARMVRATEYDTKPTLASYHYGYWSGIQLDELRFAMRDGFGMAMIPTNDGQVCVAFAWRASTFREVCASLDEHMKNALQHAPWMAEKVSAGRREEPMRAAGDLPNFFRRPYGDGWALVGDAAYHRDPVSAQGISDAFLGAERLVYALDEGFSGNRPLDAALAAYEQDRNQRVKPMYDFTTDFARLDPPPEQMARLYQALRTNQQETDRFVGTLAGTVPIPEFFAPENVQRIVTAAGGEISQASA
jgi:2-polyprenyl-6-methoxyphenol hydroxylase-like FAD-dependent oxidoreductase